MKPVSHSAMTSGARIAIAGSSGLIGTALVGHWRARGVEVLRLVRGAARQTGEIAWDPARGRLDERALGGVTAVVNLAGANIAAGRWTARRKHDLRASRIDSTRTLVDAIGRMSQKPNVLINASAVGYYGDRGDEIVTETSAVGTGFLAEVCRDWEAEALRAERWGVRVVVARLGMVLARHGGALAKLRPLFRFGLGGRLGSGRQWMSWIALEDAVRAFDQAAADERFGGAFNFTAPGLVTNRRFTAALAQAVRRPAIVPVPAVLLRFAFGEMAEATLLASTRAEPARLAAAGFSFLRPDIAEALQCA